jgi:hypothetical protein
MSLLRVVVELFTASCAVVSRSRSTFCMSGSCSRSHRENPDWVVCVNGPKCVNMPFFISVKPGKKRKTDRTLARIDRSSFENCCTRKENDTVLVCLFCSGAFGDYTNMTTAEWRCKGYGVTIISVKC